MSEYKKFSKELCDENDAIAKETAVNFLEWTKYYKLETPLSEQQELYKKQDFEITLISKASKIKVEVERKKVWDKSGKWQGWPTIDVPIRKKDSEAQLFVMTNKSCDTIAITLMSKVIGSKVSSKKTIYTENEEFFNVNLNCFRFYKKNNGGWEKF
jgi:hypothetical protein